MIDLSKKANSEMYKIKLQDGTILKLKRPTQGLLNKIVELSELGDSGLEVIDDIFSIVTRIFNNNINGLSFTQPQIEEMLDLNTTMMIISDYLQTTLKMLGK